MAEIVRLSGASGWIDLEFVEREQTPRPLMALGIRLHLSGLSLSDTIRQIETFDVDWSRKAVHDWIHKADLQPATDATANQIALDETVIRIDGQQYWLYAAVDPETNEYYHVKLYATLTIALTERFLRELNNRYDVDETIFLVDGADHLQTALQRLGLRFRYERRGNRNSSERLFWETKRRTSSFANSFSHVDPATADSWLKAHATWLNSLN